MPLEMTKEKLEAYRSNKAEIKELQYKLEHLGEGDSLIGNSVILDYRKGYPQPQAVVGYDHKLERQRRDRWEKRIGKLQAEINEVEGWIEAIPDSLIRRCFRMVYVDGLTQTKVGRKVHISQAAVSEKMSNYLKSDKSDKKV